MHLNYTLFLLIGLVFSAPVLAQKTLVVPIGVAFVEESDLSPVGLGALSGGVDLSKITVGDPEERVARVPGYQEQLAKALGKIDPSLRLLKLEDLDEKYQKGWAELSFSVYGMTDRKALIGSRQYQNTMSEFMAPFINKLCDDYDGDQVLFVYVRLTNKRKNYKKKGKAPAGSVEVVATMVDGDSGLATEKNRKNKGGNSDFSNETIYGLMVAALQKMGG